ncbi:GT2 family glycosyltransferase [Stella humosa]|uniref:GT2 family glycosyltransferase n=1 Tax=Stella humosa TaxID=94 RepID=A0A3N1MB11_9PROT|nr:glycosyltransferase family A protein [Stella humosa]ROP99949.1 GT2 family glycosyltransferase [Stella humosa]BBK30821.1 glycosyl transferase family 2 [Stella humosa]
MAHPLVSVVVPIFDAGDLLLEAIASIARQGIDDIEVIAVDDGSQDDPATRLSRAALPVVLLHQANKGPSAARNRGLSVARGRFVTFLDADDIWPRHSLAILLAAIEADPACEAAHGQVRRFRDTVEGETDGPATLLGKVAGGFNLGSALFRRELVARLGGFDETMRTAEDVDFWVRARAAGAVRTTLPDVTLYYRRGHGSLMDKMEPPVRTADHLRRWPVILARTLRARRAGAVP